MNLNRPLYAQLGKATDQKYSITKIISRIVETHVHNSIALQADVFHRLSEGSIIIKFWCTMIEALFAKTELFVNWHTQADPFYRLPC